MSAKDAVNPCSDVANAQRFVDAHKDHLFFLPQSDWHCWTGTHWAYDPYEAERCAQGIGRLVFEEAENYSALAAGSEDKSERNKLGEFAAALNKHALQSETANKVSATLRMASSHLVKRPEILDTDEWLLNVSNGTLNLETGQLQKHDPNDLITRCVETPYDAKAPCPLWERTLEQVFAGDTDLIAYIQRVMGYCITGSVREQVFFILYGDGANGKNTILGRVQEILGEYARQAAPNLLIRSKTERHPTEVWDLRGARLAVASEINQNNKLNESMIKRLIGDDVIKARGMHKDFGEFIPSHKIMLLTNYKPTIEGEDYAIWRRIHLVPFNVKFEGKNRDNDLPEKLKKEHAGILRWCVEGCTEYLKIGLAAPESVLDATKEYRSDMDLLTEFFEEHCLFGRTEQATAKAIFGRYRKWCADNGEQTQSTTWLGLKLSARNLKKRRNSAGIIWQGIGLKRT